MRLQCDYVGYPKIWQETKDELQFVNDIVVRKNSVFCLLGPSSITERYQILYIYYLKWSFWFCDVSKHP